MANINCIKGTIPPMNVSVTNLHGGKHLGDSDIDFSCVFYVNGKRRAESSIVTISKSDMTKIDADTYSCSVPTEQMPVGNMSCEVTVTSKTDQNYKWVITEPASVTIGESK